MNTTTSPSAQARWAVPASVGIASPVLFDLVACVFSRAACELVQGGRRRQTRDRNGGNVNRLGRALAAYGRTDAPSSPASHPNLSPKARSPFAATARKRVIFDSAPGIWRAATSGEIAAKVAGMSFGQQLSLWDTATRTHDASAKLPLPLLLEMFPPDLWAVMAALITDGSVLATKRAEFMLVDLAGQTVPENRRRPAGRVSAGTVTNQSHAIRQALAIVTDLGRLGHPATQYLKEWKRDLPAMAVPPGLESPSDTTAPSLQLLRKVWATVNQDVQHRLDATSADQELERIRTLPRARLSGLFWPLRNRALFLTTLLTGSRIEATVLTDREDYVRNRALPTGGFGPALRIFPAKVQEPDNWSWKPLPSEAVFAIESLMAYLDRVCGRELSGGSALFPGKLGWFKRERDLGRFLRPEEIPEPSNMNPQSGSRVFGGLRGKDGRRPLIPRYANLIDPEDPRHYDGYTAQTLRCATTEIIRSPEGAIVLERLGHGADNHVLQVLIGEALTDHKRMDADIYGYYGANRRTGRERLSGWGTQIVWTLLATSLGARTIRDSRSFVRTLERQRALRNEFEHRTREMREARAHAKQLRAAGDADGAFVAMLEAQEIEDRRAEISALLGDAKEELVALKLDPKRRIEVADPAAANPDLDVLEQEFNHGVPVHHAHKLRSVRSPAYLTITEFAEVIGVPYSTVSRWLRDRKLPRGRRYWNQDDPPIIEVTPKRSVVVYDALGAAALDTEERRLLAARFLSMQPEKWTAETAAQAQVAVRAWLAARETP